MFLLLTVHILWEIELCWELCSFRDKICDCSNLFGHRLTSIASIWRRLISHGCTLRIPWNVMITLLPRELQVKMIPWTMRTRYHTIFLLIPKIGLFTLSSMRTFTLLAKSAHLAWVFQVEKLKELAKQPDIYDRLTRSLAPNIWELDDVKRGLLCQVHRKFFVIFQSTYVTGLWLTYLHTA